MQESTIVFMKRELIIMPLDTAPSGADLFGPRFFYKDTVCLRQLGHCTTICSKNYAVHRIPNTVNLLIFVKNYLLQTVPDILKNSYHVHKILIHIQYL
jgi:hypothetical protein